MNQLLRFSLVGVGGFFVDLLVLYLAIWLGIGPLLGRPISFAAAVTFTFALNRVYTFQNKDPNLIQQWIQFASVNAIGGAINLAVYYISYNQLHVVQVYPFIGVAMGSVFRLVLELLRLKARRFFEIRGNKEQIGLD